MPAKILLTRPHKQAEVFAQDIIKLGIKPLFAPMLEIIPAPHDPPVLHEYQGLVFTSANAVHNFKAASASFYIPVYCIGEQTRQALQDAGFRHIACAHGDLDDLIKLIKNRAGINAKPLLYVRGRDVSRPLEHIFAELGIPCRSVITYEARPAEKIPETVAESLKAGQVDAVTFFSARTAQIFLERAEAQNLLPCLEKLKLLCLSEAMLKCVRSIKWKETHVARKPARKDMLELISAVCTDKNGEHGMQNNNQIRNADQIIKRFGGIRPMAAKTDIPVTTIQGWKKRGVIPASRREELAKAAQIHNIDLKDLVDLDNIANENNIKEKVSMPDQTGDREQNEHTHTEDKRIMTEKSKDTPAAPHVTPEKGDPIKELRAHSDRQKKLEQSFSEERQKTLKEAAVIALVLVAVTAVSAFFLLRPELQKISQNENNIETLEQNVTGIETEVNGLKAEFSDQKSLFGDFLPGNWEKQIEDLKLQAEEAKEQVSQAMERAGQVSDDVLGKDAGTLQERVTNLGEHAADITGAHSLSSLAGKLGAMMSSNTGQEQLDQAVKEINALLQLQETTETTETETAFESILQAGRSQSTALGETFEDVPQEDLKAAALLLGLSQFRSSLNRNNEPFDDDLALLISLAGKDNPELQESLQRLAPHAESGILTPEGLSNEFRGMAGDVVIASLKGEDVSIADEAKVRLGEAFVVKKDGEQITGTEIQKKVARTEQLLNEGKIAEAVGLMKTLEGPEAQVIKPWLEKAQATLQARNVESLLSGNILQNLFSGQIPQGAGQLFVDEKSGVKIYQPGPRLPRSPGLPGSQ